MSRLGTCKHCFQIQEAYVIGDRPGDKPERVLDAEEYTCQWLDQFQPLPPAIDRKHGGFDLREGDCDVCTQYEPASSWPSTLAGGSKNEPR